MKIKPTKNQLKFLSWEMGVFFHFGIRTFYEEHIDWDEKAMDLSGFNPVELNCDDWIKTIADAGAKYAVLVCKHHDGFALWPSEYTEYSVEKTPWKNGNGDVVREYVDACRKHNIKVGLYYSPAEFGSKKKNHKEYDDYFINQISELLGNYGEIEYLWFDGCGSEGHKYDEKRIISAIRALQPEILIFNMWGPDTRWVGNEIGIAQLDNRNTTSALEFSVLAKEEQLIDEYKFLPAECDCRIRETWFYSEKESNVLKSLDALVGMYYHSVGNGANLLLNIAPDRRGLLPIDDKNRFLEFGNKIKEDFSTPITHTLSREGDKFKLELNKHTLVNNVVLKENLSEGESIEEFKISLLHGKRWYVYSGKTIGHKRICKFPTVGATGIEIEITKSNGNYIMDAIELYYIEN